jgi:LysR family nitrogen assimilation transcriptional regulator
VNLRQLKYFLSVVDAGNMTRAAEQLHVAQTALGMQIRQLEESLGVPLLVRHSRGVEATKAGAILRERAIAILKLVDETRKEVSASQQMTSEPIRVGITPALMMIVGTEIALTAREQLPYVSLSLVEAMSHVLAETLARGEVDFILCYDVPDLPQFTRTAILQDDLVLVTLPGEDPGQPVPFAEVLDHVLAMPEDGDTVRTAVARAARDMQRELKVAYEVRSIPAMKNLVARGAAASVLPFFSVIDEVREGKLDARQIVTPSIRRTLFLASSRQRSPLQNEAGLTNAIRSSLRIVTDALGPLAHPL